VKKIRLITDGACQGNPGPGGWAAILRYNEQKKELWGCDRHTTNNRMELLAAIEGLRALKEPCEVEVVTDSEYLKNGITTWIHNWKRKGWMTPQEAGCQSGFVAGARRAGQSPPGHLDLDQGPRQPRRQQSLRRTCDPRGPGTMQELKWML
jgi:hypothetical protein